MEFGDLRSLRWGAPDLTHKALVYSEVLIGGAHPTNVRHFYKIWHQIRKGEIEKIRGEDLKNVRDSGRDSDSHHWRGEVDEKSKRKDGRGGDWATVWVEAEEGLKKYELVYDYAAGSIKKGKEAQRGRGSLPRLAVSWLWLWDRGSHFLPSLLAVGSCWNPGCFSFFALRVISLQDRPKQTNKK